MIKYQKLMVKQIFFQQRVAKISKWNSAKRGETDGAMLLSVNMS